MRARMMAFTLALAMGLAIPVTSVAALLGLTLDFPQVLFNNQGTLTYSALTDTLALQATPLAIRLAPTNPPITILPDPTFGGGLFIGATVDDTGLLVGGVPGDDLAVFGEVDLGPLGFFSGLLLTGEIAAFGFQDSGGPTDFFDFKFTPTGGQIAFMFTGGEIGVDVTSESSTFVGTFTMTAGDPVEFSGEAKGTLGFIPPEDECPCLCPGDADSDSDGDTGSGSDSDSDRGDQLFSLTSEAHSGDSDSENDSDSANGGEVCGILCPAKDGDSDTDSGSDSDSDQGNQRFSLTSESHSGDSDSDSDAGGTTDGLVCVCPDDADSDSDSDSGSDSDSDFHSLISHTHSGDSDSDSGGTPRELVCPVPDDAHSDRDPDSDSENYSKAKSGKSKKAKSGKASKGKSGKGKFGKGKKGKSR